MPKVTLYSRARCCLCDEVRRKLESLRDQVDFELEEVNIDQDAELRRLYNEEVPVVAIDGRAAFKYGLHPEEFLKKLRASR